MSFSDHIKKFASINDTAKEMFTPNDKKVCRLRKVAEGIVATIDERPEIGAMCFNTTYNTIKICYNKFEDQHKIIASTFKVGKEFVVNDESIGFLEELEFDKEYEYTETETQVIIKL